LEDFSIGLLDQLVDKKAEAIVILIPSIDSRNNISVGGWYGVEQALFQKEYKIPIYFTYDDDQVKKMYRDGFEQLGDRHQLVVSTYEPTLVKDVTAVNIQVTLLGKTDLNQQTEDEDIKINPSIVVVTNYDSYNIAPIYGESNNGASTAANVVSILELSRLFSKLYSSSKTQTKYNLIFLIHAGNSLNYAGSKHWINNADIRLLESAQFVLSIDSIINTLNSKEDKLYFHISKSPKQENIPLTKFYESFNLTSKQLNVPFQFVHKKINILPNGEESSIVDWEHELFAIKKLISATISAYSYPIYDSASEGNISFSRSHLFDDLRNVNKDILFRNIKFIAESIAKYIYDFSGDNSSTKNLEIFSGSLEVNKQFIESWMQTLTSTNRVLFSDKLTSSNQLSNLLNGLSKTLIGYSNEVSNQTFKIDEYVDFKYFNGLKQSMSVYRVKPTTFDLFLLLAVIGYLAVLYIFVKGPSDTISQIKKLFQKSSKAKKKN